MTAYDLSIRQEHFQVKWVRFTVENAPQRKKRADSMLMETALTVLRLSADVGESP